MKCVNCGVQLGSRAKFCSNCGAEVKTDLVVPRRFTGWHWLIIGSMVLLAILIAVIFVMVGGKKEESEVPEIPTFVIGQGNTTEEKEQEMTDDERTTQNEQNQPETPVIENELQPDETKKEELSPPVVEQKDPAVSQPQAEAPIVEEQPQKETPVVEKEPEPTPVIKIDWSKFLGTYVDPEGDCANGPCYMFEFKGYDESTGQARFVISYVGKNLSPLYITETITATLDENGSASFQWQDSWGNKGVGSFTLSDGVIATCRLTMTVTEEAEGNRATLATNGTKELTVLIL